MSKQQDYTQTVYLAIADGVIKIGKSEYHRRYIRAYELNKAEGLATVKRFNFNGSTVKALAYESMLRIAVSLINGTTHYGNDHFTATAQSVQMAIDLFDTFVQIVEKHLNSFTRDIKKAIKEYQSNR